MKDPLDVEVARVANSMVHGFLIERVDPPLRGAPKPGEEVKAQYAISNALARKVLNCRLVIISRSESKGGETRKVMCRVGGGTCQPFFEKSKVFSFLPRQVGRTCRCIC